MLHTKVENTVQFLLIDLTVRFADCDITPDIASM